MEPLHFKVEKQYLKHVMEKKQSGQELHTQCFGQKELLLGAGWDVPFILQQLALILYIQLT